jgi:outer membrane lipoprotein SlyB
MITAVTNCEGDRFTARVIEPSKYEEAVIQGHAAKIERSGRMTGRTEMALAFDAITLRNGRSGTFHAQIEKVFATESVKSVDEEGNVESASKTKETEIRAIGGAVLGAIIGGIAGGGKGAAIGTIIGAGAGAGSVYVQGDKDLILEPGAQIIVRVDYLLR